MTPTRPDRETSKVVRALNGILRNENTMTESYNVAIARVHSIGAADVEVLRAIASEHDAAKARLRDAIRNAGGLPDESTGSWPAFVKHVDGPGGVFNDAVMLQALRDAEEHGLRTCLATVDLVGEETAPLIQESLIPAQIRHIESLDSMISRL